MPTNDLDLLREYGANLKAAGFRVLLTKTSRVDGYLQYEKNGCYGTFSESYFEGYSHHMPIVPSKEFGSSMFIGKAVEDVWSVEAAEQCARPFNHNRLVGDQANARNRTWVSPKAEEL